MFSPVSSTRIPDEALKHIVDNLDFRSLQTLRKTCCDLRNYIDDTRLNTNVTSIRVTVHSEAVYLRLVLGDKTEFDIGYQKTRNGCSVVLYASEKTTSKMIHNTNFMKVFDGDLRIILNQQSSLLHAFCLIFEHYNFENQDNRIKSMETVATIVIDNLEKALKSKKCQLQVEEFEIEMMDQTRISSILSRVDSRKLKKITLASAELRAREPLRIEELEILDQWKNAKKLEIYQFVVTRSIKTFLHFEEIKIVLDSLSEVDLLYLRKSFLHSPHLKLFKIHSRSLNGSLNLVKIFGSYDDEYTDKDGNKQRRWVYLIPNIGTDHILMIQYDFYSCIHFSRVRMTDLRRDL